MLINFNDRHAITVSGINNCPGKAICDGDLVLFTMKKTIFLLVLVLIMGICTGCGKENTEIEKSCMKEQTTSESSENDEIHLDDELNIDFTCDYSEDIKEDVDDVVAASTSLQEELTNMEKVTQKYTPLAEAAQTQGEMNVAAHWLYTIWDTELNNLWSRLSSSADRQTKEKLLAEQRNWIDLKEEVTLLNIGSREENGSMYPLLQDSYLEEITKNRAYVVARELAKIKGEDFAMPEVSAKYGTFVDNQETGDIYSSLITRQNWEGTDEAVISIYRQGEMEGSFVDHGNGELSFTSEDGSVKGMIKIDGWNGASFKVTETYGESPFSAGEEVEFPFAF